MKDDWEKGVTFVLKMEGGSTVENDPNDPGGETKFGISKQSYPSLNIKDLTVEEAREIYHRDFWNACSCDDLPMGFAIATFDCAVNMGTTRAKRILQMALGVTVDGAIGPKTLAAAAKGTRSDLKRMLAHRLAEYARIMDKNENLRRYDVNWFYRVISLADLVLNQHDEPGCMFTTPPMV